MEWEREGLHIEYKKAKNSIPKSMWETYSAFMNTDGGTIYLGVEENELDNTMTITGVENATKILKQIVVQARNPDFITYNDMTNVTIDILTIENKEVIKIFVPQVSNRSKPVFIKNKTSEAYVRVNESDQLLKPDELSILLKDRQPELDGKVLTNYTLEDLNKIDLALYKAAVIEQEGSDRYEGLSDEQFAQEVGITAIDRSNNRRNTFLTFAGLLFLGKWSAIMEVVPNLLLDYSISPSPDHIGYDQRIISGNGLGDAQNIFGFYRQVYDSVQASINNPFEIKDDGFTRKDSGVAIKTAVRELLVNALSHAMYGEGRITIRQYDDRIILSNPGKFRISIEEFQIGNSSSPRNPKIVTLFRHAGLQESYGIGGRKVFEISDRLGLKSPEIETSIEKTAVTLWRKGYEALLQDDLSENELNILKYIIDNNSASNSDLEVVVPKLYDRRKALKSLKEKNIIKTGGQSRATRYYIASQTPLDSYQISKSLAKMHNDLLK